MPIFDANSDPAEWIEPDDVPRPVVAYGVIPGDFGDIELEPHSHVKGQIILVQSGALTCETGEGLWIAPTWSAIWIPGGTIHGIKATGIFEGYGAFVDADLPVSLPQSSCAVSVTPLLRELLIRAASLPLFYPEDGVNSRLIDVLLDELATARVEDLHLPMPRDARLRRIADGLMKTPDDRRPLEAWATWAGLSERTLLRLTMKETGMSFGRWRQQLSVLLAIRWLADGNSIQQVAADLGYESVPSFVTMFRRTLGTPPGRYMAERHSHGTTAMP